MLVTSSQKQTWYHAQYMWSLLVSHRLSLGKIGQQTRETVLCSSDNQLH